MIDEDTLPAEGNEQPELDPAETEQPEPQERQTDAAERRFETRRDKRIKQLLSQRHQLEDRATAAERRAMELERALAEATAARAGSDHTRATSELAQAKARLKQAMADGDAEAAAEAQEALARATVAIERARDEQQRADMRAKQPVPEVQPTPPQWREWLESDEGQAWSTDPAVKDAARGFHAKALAAGHREMSPGYFQFVNARIRAAFPENFETDDGAEGAEDEAAPPPAKPQTPRPQQAAAPRRNPPPGTTPPRTVRLTAEERAFAKSIGVSEQVFAAQKAATDAELKQRGVI